MNDYLCLGTTIPEESKKYGVRVCTAGVSLQERKLMRVYPMFVDKHFKRWEYAANIKLMLNPKDNRLESFKMNREEQKFEDIHVSKYKASLRKKLIQELYNDQEQRTIMDLNKARKSLAIVRLFNPQGYFVGHSKKERFPEQLSLLEEPTNSPLVTKKGFDFLPRIAFKDEEGKPHDLWMNSWDAYMHQRMLAPKYGIGNLWEALHLKEGSFALIGNMNSLRNTWLIISIF